MKFSQAETEADCATFGHYDTEQSDKLYYASISASNYLEKIELEDLEQSDDDDES